MSLLIDVNKIINPHKMSSLNKRLGTVPPTREIVGVVIVTNEKIMTELKAKQKGDERIKFMNTSRFVESIEDCGYISFNMKKKICNIPLDSVSCVDEIIKNTLRYLPNDFTLCCKVPLHETELISTLIDNGFDKTQIKHPWLGMYRSNNVSSGSSSGPDVLLTTKVNNYSHCGYKARLSDDAINYLSGLPHRGVTLKGDVFSQKEIAGSLVTGMTDASGVNHLHIGGEQNYGGVENANTTPSMLTFHTHPVEAYDRHDVNVGWPSKTDYISFLKVSEQVNLIMHIVVAVEGFYVISVHKEWFESPEKFDDRTEDVIRNSIAFEKSNSRTGSWHVNHINKLKVDGLHVLKVFFVDWSKPKTIFEVFYNNVEGQCKIPK
jgi:hypothetical protein